MANRTKWDIHIESWKKFKKKGPLIALDDLESNERSWLATKIFQLFGPLDEQSKYEAYMNVLHEYGIMCPHPQHKRLYGGTEQLPKPSDQHLWYDCTMCSCTVLNEDRFRRMREEKEANDVGGGPSADSGTKGG
jgi:hypothetical protein